MPNANDAPTSDPMAAAATDGAPRAAAGRGASATAPAGGSGVAPLARVRARARARPLRTAAAVLVAGSTFWLLASARVPCAFARLTGLPCPGCGSTRAMLALAHGDVAAAVRANPLAPVLSALVLVLALQVIHAWGTTGTLGTGGGRLRAYVSRGILVVAVLEVVIWLARFAGCLGGPVPV